MLGMEGTALHLCLIFADHAIDLSVPGDTSIDAPRALRRVICCGVGGLHMIQNDSENDYFAARF
jgi:hypothetical protein